MKLIIASLLIASANAFVPSTPTFTTQTSTSLSANIRGPTDKSEELRFGWDGSTALGGAVVDSQPARMLDMIREAGETIPDDCEIFNANLEMDGDSVMFEDVIAVSTVPTLSVL
jgi:hypothetical protein